MVRAEPRRAAHAGASRSGTSDLRGRLPAHWFMFAVVSVALVRRPRVRMPRGSIDVPRRIFVFARLDGEISVQGLSLVCALLLFCAVCVLP